MPKREPCRATSRGEPAAYNRITAQPEGVVPIFMEISDAALTLLAEAGFDPVFGARPLKRVVQERIENPLSRLILDGTLGAKDRVKAFARLEIREASA